MNAITVAPRLIIEDAFETHLVVPAPLVPPKIRLSVSEGGIHPGAGALALAGFALFLVASWVGWGFGYTTLLIGVIYLLSAMYFGMLLLFSRTAAASRGDVSKRSFQDFLNGRVEIFEGRISGREALIQIAFMPILLGPTMSFFAIPWLSIR